MKHEQKGLLSEIAWPMFDALFDALFDASDAGRIPEPAFAMDFVYAACGL